MNVCVAYWNPCYLVDAKDTPKKIIFEKYIFSTVQTSSESEKCRCSGQQSFSRKYLSPPKKYVFTMPPSSESERCRRRWATDPTSPHPTFANCTQLALYTLNSWEKLGGKLFEFLFLLCRMYAAADLVLIWVLWPSLFLGGVAFLWPLHDRQHGGIVELRSG